MILVSEQRASSKDLAELDEHIEQAEALLYDIEGRETATGAFALALTLGGMLFGPIVGEALAVQDIMSLLGGAATGLSVGMIFVVLNAVRSGRAGRALKVLKDLRAKAVEV